MAGTLFASILLVVLIYAMILRDLWLGVYGSHGCCACPSDSCSLAQWPCCTKKTKWWIKIFG
ncbi:uncharacterized protein [Drosophila tropicalis]|uniref:uncharacterized protein n=1 Tax=Drosophila tropicalis TaxID=46794 RepID=UPI0035ABFABD